MIRCTVVDFLEIQLRLKNIVIQNGIVHEGLLRRYYFDNTLSLSRPKKEKKIYLIAPMIRRKTKYAIESKSLTNLYTVV